MFLLNTWYVACKADEIPLDKPLGRTICNERMAFYRTPQGIAAVEDFCPHRGAPLSLGFVCEGKLVCGYHGLEMGCDGKTIAMPGQRVRGFPEIRSYPVEERHGFIWVWPGDTSRADAHLIPQLHWAGHPDWAYVLERQQANLTRWPERRLLLLNIDAGGVQSRRVIDRLLAAERTEAA